MLVDCQNNEGHNFSEDQSKYLQQQCKIHLVVCTIVRRCNTKRPKETVSFQQYQSMWTILNILANDYLLQRYREEKITEVK
jgi:hypothetical protein